jgi:hypothetical protein
VHPNSQLLFQKYALEHFQPELRVLEIGPDGFPSSYRRIIGDRTAEWDTLDLFAHPE